jgi:hypothetical protein
LGATIDGFETLEVWESKEHYDRANADIVFPLMRELAGNQPLPRSGKPRCFDVRGLVIPGGNVAVNGRRPQCTAHRGRADFLVSGRAIRLQSYVCSISMMEWIWGSTTTSRRC